MPCTSLCSSAGTLMRRTSPCTRIMGGRPDDRCRSDALFLTTKASNSVRSITILPEWPCEVFFVAGSGHYGNNCGQPASSKSAHRARRGRGAAGPRGRDLVGSLEDASGCPDQGGARRRPEGIRRELRAGSDRENGRPERRAPGGGRHRVAPDRPFAKQQDAPRRRALRLGANHHQRKNRAPPVGAAAGGPAAPERADSGERFRRSVQERSSAGGGGRSCKGYCFIEKPSPSRGDC